MVNALLIGLFAGQALSGSPDRPPRPDGPPLRAESRIAEGVISAATPDQRRAIRRAFGAALVDARGEIANRRRAQRALSDAMSADPYDPDQMAEAFRTLREAETALEASIHEALTEQFGEMTPAQRKALSRALADPGKGERRRRFQEWRDRRNARPEDEDG